MDVMKGRTAGTHEDLERLFAALPESGRAFVEEMRAALSGDNEAHARILSLTAWEAYLGGKGLDVATLSPAYAFLVGVEKSSAGALALVRHHEFKLEARELAHHPLASRIVSPDSLASFEAAGCMHDILPVQAAAAIESHLAWIAAMDVQTSHDNGWNRSLVLDLMSTHARAGRNPAARFFDWIQREAGAATIQQLHEAPALVNGGIDLDLTTLKRWSAGYFQPHQALLLRIVETLFDERTQEMAGFLNYCMRHLNFVGHLAQAIIDRVSSMDEALSQGRMRPWPNYPFGHESFEDWFQTRYTYWLAFHRQRQQSSATTP